MEHHAVPQQITEYEFRLVGSMTLKQFVKLAGGLILAFIVFNSSLIFFIKWPLIIGFASFGAALAFLPINEQPLEKWVLAFFQSIYAPTIYIWQKHPQSFDLGFQDYTQPTPQPKKPVETKDKEPKLNEYLASIEEDKQEKSVEEKEDKTKRIEDKSDKDKKSAGGKTEDKKSKVEPQHGEYEQNLILDLPTEKPEATAEAEFGDIPRPQPPKTPNKVVGMIFNQEGKLIENAIIEIQDKNGNAVRALRTNRLGQFETATPLSNGEYLVTVEKEGYNFDILKIEATGEVLSPLIIKAKNGNGNG